MIRCLWRRFQPRSGWNGSGGAVSAVALGDAGGDAVLIVGAVARERGNGIPDVIQQGAHLRAVIHVLDGQHGVDDPPSVSGPLKTTPPEARRTQKPAAPERNQSKTIALAMLCLTDGASNPLTSRRP